MYVDPWCRGEKDKQITWILIENPYKGGYPDHLEIAWGSSNIHQRLDFWGIPFRCFGCHKTGHLIKNCSHRFSRRIKESTFNRDRKSESEPSRESLDVQVSSLQREQKLHATNKNHDLLPQPDLCCSFQDLLGRADAISSPPIIAHIPEPHEDIPVPSPPDMNQRDFVIGSLPIQISSSSPSLVKAHSADLKGKKPIQSQGNDPCLMPSLDDTLSESPINNPDSDIDFLLKRSSLDLEPLTIHKPISSPIHTISPNSAKNITVRKKSKGGSHHFRGRSVVTSHGVRNLSLVEVPVLDSSEFQPLRACMVGDSSK